MLDEMTDTDYTKALIYCRVSSERQVKEGGGLDSQEHRCRTDAASIGVEVEEVFREEGISGSLFDRPAMMNLLRYLDDHWETKYVVIFDDLKRFARDVGVHRKLKAELHAREARLRCLNYQFDDSAEGEFVETIFAAQNELERKQNRRQVCQKMKARVERGYWCFHPPLGYEFKKNREHGKLIVPIHAITNILSRALIDFSENRLLEQTDVLNFLVASNLHGLLGREKSRINHDYVKRILTEPIYAGIIEYPEWGISRRKGHHKAIISEEVYDKIQDKLRKPERKPRENDNREFPLRRVIDCAFCNKKLTGSTSRGKRKYYSHYTCNNKECIANPKNITASKVEDDYIELLENIKVSKEVLEMAKVMAMRIWQQKVKDINAGKASNQAEINAIEKQINDFLNLIPSASSEALRSRYEAKIVELDNRIVELKKGLENKKEPNFEEALNLTLQFLGTPAETWKLSSKELKTMVHNMIFEVNPKYSLKDGFGTPKVSLPFGLRDLFGALNNNMVDHRRVERRKTKLSK